MSLRTLDLRGTAPPFEALLPRPAAPGSDVHDVVAGILQQVRAEGDAGSRPPHRAAGQGRSVRRAARPPRRDREGLRRRRSRTSGAPSRWPTGASWPTTRTRGRHPGTWSRAASRSGTSPGRSSGPASTRRAGAPATRPPSSCAPLRPGWPGWGASSCACPRPPTGGSTPRPSAPPPSPGSTRSTGSAGRRPSPPWPTGRPASPPSTSSPVRATPTWPKPSVSSRAWSGWRRPSPGPRRSWWWPGRTRRRRSPPWTWSCRPSTGPTAWPGW